MIVIITWHKISAEFNKYLYSSKIKYILEDKVKSVDFTENIF